jgi:hypothetical protein
LESACAFTRTVGSNPTLSAIICANSQRVSSTNSPRLAAPWDSNRRPAGQEVRRRGYGGATNLMCREFRVPVHTPFMLDRLGVCRVLGYEPI